MKKTITMIIFAGLIILLIVYFKIYFRSENRSFFNPLLKDLISPRPISKYSTWVPNWDEEEAIESLKKAKNELSVISPVWYLIEKNGLINQLPADYRQSIIDLASENKIAIVPTIGNEFDGQRISLLLRNQDLNLKLTQNLILIAKENHFQGWDLDWERIEASDSSRFSVFVQKLAHELHQQNLLLSITVHARTGQKDEWIGAKGHDYSKLGQSADLIRIMAYDFHHPGSDSGPITPLDKLTQVINYSLKTIPQEKIVLSLPLYGYDWNQGTANSLTYVQTLEQLKIHQASYAYNLAEEALTAEYQFQNFNHTLWFEDSQSVLAKINLANKLGISQFCFWKLGGEDQKLWDKLAELTSQISKTK